MTAVLRPIVVKSPEARRELARAWPDEMVAFLAASAKVFGIAEEIVVEDEQTIKHMQEWRLNKEREEKARIMPTVKAEIAKQKEVTRA